MVGPHHTDTLTEADYSPAWLNPSTEGFVTLLLTICLRSQSPILTPSCPSRNPGDYQGRSNAMSYKEPTKANDGLRFVMACV